MKKKTLKKDNLVLVTGGAGFIGSHTVDIFIENGFKVRVMDNLQNHDKKWPGYLNKKAQKMVGDIRNIADWEKALKGVTHVVHLAAIMDFHLEFSNYFQVNTVGTANLYEVIVKKNLPVKKVVIASSQFVYGYGRWKCKQHGIVHPGAVSEKLKEKEHWDPVCPTCGKDVTYLKNKEEHVDPTNQYAISKFTQELVGLRLGKIHNIPTTALRYSIVHGSRQSVKNLYSGALRVFCLQILDDKKILLFEDGNMFRDFVSVKDVARANYLSATKKKADYQVYNVGGGIPYTIKELAEMVANELGKELKYDLGAYREGDVRHELSDISKIKEIGWTPKVTELQSIKDFLAWLNLHKITSKSVDRVFSEMKQKGVLKGA